MRSYLMHWVLICVVASHFIPEGCGASPSPARGLRPDADPGTPQAWWRSKRSETEDVSLDKRRRSIIKALDEYFGFQNPNARIARDMMTGEMDSEQEKQSEKKDLIHRTMSMGKEATDAVRNESSKSMPMIVLAGDADLKATVGENEMQKMKAVVDHMLADMLSSNLMMNFRRPNVPSVMRGHISDIMHGFEHPMMRDFKDVRPPAVGKANLELLKESLSPLSPLHLGSEFATSNVATEAGQNLGDDANRGLGKSTDNREQNLAAEPHFTTLEVALGPAILPLNPPEGYFVPFIPRKAFGVTNGVSRPPHGHASFYLHRPPGLVDVPNSPAFGFFFSGHTRSPEIEETNQIAPESRDVTEQRHDAKIP